MAKSPSFTDTSPDGSRAWNAVDPGYFRYLVKNPALMTQRLLCLIVIATVLASCRKDEQAAGTDKELYDEAAATTGFTYYRNHPYLLQGSQNLPHKPFFKVRFNAIAQAALDSTGRLPLGSFFPDGALIVKELHDTETGPVSLFAVMKKDPSHLYATAGWLWAEVRPDAKVVVSVEKKGASCIDCHSHSSRDMVRIFDLY